MLKDQNKRQRPICWYLSIMLIMVGVYYIYCIAFRGSGFASLYVFERSDTFMDHFNSLTNANIDPYKDGFSNYPAMACLIYKILAHAIPQEIRGSSTGRELALIYRADQIPMMVFLLLNVLVLWIVVSVAQNRLEKTGKIKYIIALLIIVCAPMMFTLERGNLILLSFGLSFFFAFHYNDDNKVVKELAYISLAIAAAIKIYPAILGLLVVKKGKIKDILRLLMYGALFFILPFFVYDGFESLKIMIQALLYTNNLTASIGFGINVSLYNICESVLLAFGLQMSNKIAVIAYVLTISVLIVCFFTAKKRWKEQLCAVLLIVLLPKTNYYYIMIFLLIPFTEMISEIFENGLSSKRECRYAGLFMLWMVPLALPVIPLFSDYSFPLYFSMFLYYLGLLCAIVFLFSDLLILKCKNKFLKAISWAIDGVAVAFCCFTVCILM